MRTRVALFSLAFVAIGTGALAQHHGGGHGTSHAGGTDAAAGDASAPSAAADAGARGGDTAARDAGAHSADAAHASVASDASATVAANADAGSSATAAASTPVAASTPAAEPTTFNLPMIQRGSGAITHYPVPEQLARNDVPVFVQVRSSAPLDHVSLFYRGQGASHFREIRMNAMGQNLSLPGGYGAQVPCEDAFPPAVEYYVQAIDTSGSPVGTAGSAQAPVRVPVVTARTHAVVPTLPGQAAPRNCGGITVNIAGGANGADGGAGTEVLGTADLGEPCHANNDCRRGLRCGATHTCVFIQH